MMDVDVAPPELAHLRHPEARLSHHCDHRSAADPVPVSGPVHLGRDREQLLQLVGLEQPANQLRGFQPAAAATGRVARDQSALSRISVSVTSVLLMLPLLRALRDWPRLSRSGSPAAAAARTRSRSISLSSR